MKKQETVEVKYIKLNNALIIAFICLLIGFIAGNLYDVLKGAQAGLSSPAYSPGSAGISTDSDRIKALEKEVQSNPDNHFAWLELGNLYFDSGQPDKAIPAYSAYLKIKPDNPDVLTDLGVMYRRTRQFVKALEMFDRAAAISPGHQQSRFNRGIVLLNDMKDKEAALQAWQEVERINPQFLGPDGRSIREMIESIK